MPSPVLEDFVPDASSASHTIGYRVSASKFIIQIRLPPLSDEAPHLRQLGCGPRGEEADGVRGKNVEKGVVVSRARYLDNEEVYPTTHSVKAMVNSELSSEELERALTAIEQSVQELGH
ncbi:hypothetical protein AAVH_05216 [Aphelenchoides avenae]|nr:hypothetical protein AAVH_05216 [Aphelenchus avenae]